MMRRMILVIGILLITLSLVAVEHEGLSVGGTWVLSDGELLLLPEMTYTREFDRDRDLTLLYRAGRTFYPVTSPSESFIEYLTDGYLLQAECSLPLSYSQEHGAPIIDLDAGFATMPTTEVFQGYAALEYSSFSARHGYLRTILSDDRAFPIRVEGSRMLYASVTEFMAGYDLSSVLASEELTLGWEAGMRLSEGLQYRGMLTSTVAIGSSPTLVVRPSLMAHVQLSSCKDESGYLALDLSGRLRGGDLVSPADGYLDAVALYLDGQLEAHSEGERLEMTASLRSILSTNLFLAIPSYGVDLHGQVVYGLTDSLELSCDIQIAELISNSFPEPSLQISAGVQNLFADRLLVSIAAVMDPESSDVLVRTQASLLPL